MPGLATRLAFRPVTSSIAAVNAAGSVVISGAETAVLDIAEVGPRTGTAPDDPVQPDAMAERLATALEQHLLRDVTLVVHDFGGPIALPMALEQPGRVRALVVLNSWMWSLEGDPHIERGSRLLTSALGRRRAGVDHLHDVRERNRAQEQVDLVRQLLPQIVG